MSLAALTAALAAGCGSDGDQVAGVDRGGNPVAVVTKGEITGFGSVIVNGVRWETGAAEIVIDGAPGTEADLSLGAVVTLQGEQEPGADSGTAVHIDFDDNVEGLVESFDSATGVLTVLGQSVHVSLDTVIEASAPGIGPDDIVPGDAVEVSGFARPDGGVDATLLRLKDVPDRLEVTGTAAQVDTGALTLRVGALIIDYSSAMLDGFPGGAPSNGDLVEARGTQQGPGGELIAETLEFRERGLAGAGEGDEAEVKGLITRYVSPEDFDVDGQPVTTDADTVYARGSAALLGVNVRVEVEGTVTADGVILADRIAFEEESQARAEGTADSVDAAAGTLVVAGAAIATDQRTLFRDASSQRLRPFRIDDISPGDALSVAGRETAQGIDARRVTREDAADGVVLRALARDVAAPDFVLLGVTVTTDGATVFESEDGMIDAAAFFTQADGRPVEAEARPAGAVLVASRVRLLE